MSIGKKFALIFLFILINTFLVIGYLVIRNAILLNELRNEVVELANLDITKDSYNTKIKTSGNYAVVEKAVKSYMDDYAKLLQESLKIVSDPKLTKILSYGNYEADGPEFVESLKYLNEEKEKFNKNLDKLIELSNKDTINSYIDDKVGDKYYRDLYIELMSQEKMASKFSNTKTSLEEIRAKVNVILDESLSVLNFLVSNKDSWKLENGEIKFINNDLYNQYVDHINKVKIES